MSKRIFISLIIALCVIFSSTICFAEGLQNAMSNVGGAVENVAENTKNMAQDAVGGTERMIEGAAGTISNTSKNITGYMTTNNDDDYTATRTGTDNNATGMGTNNTWTWLIVGITAIAIVALIWYYSMQRTSNYDHHNNNYDE